MLRLAARAYVWLPPVMIAAVPSVACAQVHLAGADDVVASFRRDDEGWHWAAYSDTQSGRQWEIAGPEFSLQTLDGRRVNLGDLHYSREETDDAAKPSMVRLEADLDAPPVTIRREFSFCADGRTLRARTFLKSRGDPVTIQRVGLLELRVPGQVFRLMGPGSVSSPVFGDGIFAGIEHPSAWCQVDGDTFYLAQHSNTEVGSDWTELPSAVFGSVAQRHLRAGPGDEPLRAAFLEYLDTVRVKPADIHVHYNNWWTMPVPFSEEDVLANIAALRAGLYDKTGFFFDSYALDMGWSDSHSVWQVNAHDYPEGFRRISNTLREMGGSMGLWISPSSLYPPALDNKWLQSEGYEVTPNSWMGLNACLARGGRYQTVFLQAALKHARGARLGHMKFDGLVQTCDDPSHGHPVGEESRLSIAEGLMEVLDDLRARNPGIALEPTCLGYYPSPWWLMHTPFVIGPFGDDCPRGRCPAPEWLESLTTGREIENLKGRDAFLMPADALECFDIILQCPGDIQNHAVMAVGRGHWFVSCYINPKYMDDDEWAFFADLMRWARANRESLRNPMPFGGDPARGEAYGYWFRNDGRWLYCVRNPWIEEADLKLPGVAPGPWTARKLYPGRDVLRPASAAGEMPTVHLGPYETAFVEAVPTADHPRPSARREPAVEWRRTAGGGFRKLEFEPEPAGIGRSWTSAYGDADSVLTFNVAGKLSVGGAKSCELCVLSEGPAGAAGASCTITVDGEPAPLTASSSDAAFAATGRPQDDQWKWFLVPLTPGAHELSVTLEVPSAETRCGVFLRGTVPVGEDNGLKPIAQPSFPLYRPGTRSWSYTLAPMRSAPADIPTETVKRIVERIDGIFLDSLDWVEATAGWGETRKRTSIMGTPMLIGGQRFTRGIGAHAASRVVYDLPEGYSTFAAEIGCDCEVQAGTVIFVIEGDGKELYRSQVLRCGDAPVEVRVPISGVKRLVLIAEDAGDGISADHADWANARLLR